jgi:hypothetical protein
MIHSEGSSHESTSFIGHLGLGDGQWTELAKYTHHQDQGSSTHTFLFLATD